MGELRADFRGDVAIVTGGASGIGAAITSALADAGARVHVFDSSIEHSAEPGENRHAVDVRSTDAVEAGVARVLEIEGQVDLLVNNAGIVRDHALWKLTDEEWHEVLEVNLSGAHRVLRAVAPSMRERRRGRIVQIASVNALRGKFGQSNYAASKGGLVALTKAAARELGPRGITINAVAPGMIETPLSAALSEDVREDARQETALGRLGAPEDIVGAVLFLLSEQAAHVTGSVLVVDGGALA